MPRRYSTRQSWGSLTCAYLPVPAYPPPRVLSTALAA